MTSRDLKSPAWMYVKAVAFVLIALLAAALVWLENPRWQTAVLLSLLAWSAARAYYFAFYVLGRYIDPKYRFAGLISMVGYLFRRRARRADDVPSDKPDTPDAPDAPPPA